jgi:hypothetical protein
MFAARQGFFPAIATAPAGPARRTGIGESNTPRAFTSQSGAASSTTYSQFGGGSLNNSGVASAVYFNSYNTNRVTGGNGGWPTGTGDFCIEGWLWVPAARSRTESGSWGGLNLTGGLMVRIGPQYQGANFNYIQILSRGNADLDRAPFTWPNETWCHWAVQRKSAVVSIWANGNKLARENGPTAPGTCATRSFSASTNTQVVWGAYASGAGGDEDLKAWQDECCVSNSWRYDDAYSTYTIPTSAFVVDEFTCMLTHWDTNLTSAHT